MDGDRGWLQLVKEVGTIVGVFMMGAGMLAPLLRHERVRRWARTGWRVVRAAARAARAALSRRWRALDSPCGWWAVLVVGCILVSERLGFIDTWYATGAIVAVFWIGTDNSENGTHRQ